MNRRVFLTGLAGLSILPIVPTKQSSNREQIDWICKNYATLSNDKKQEVLQFITEKATKRKTEGNTKEGNLLATFAVYLATNYGGFEQ